MRSRRMWRSNTRTHSHSPLSPPKMGVGLLFQIDLTDLIPLTRLVAVLNASNGIVQSGNRP
jgi:hypothetical protein